MTGAPRAPYALEPTFFRFPHLAAQAGRAGMGGPREIALACLVVARIAADCIEDGTNLLPDQLRTRSMNARHWLGAATLPANVRHALVRLAETSVGDDPASLKAAVESVIAVTANQLDAGARLELARLAQTVAA